jgi:hypothetical protein
VWLFVGCVCWTLTACNRERPAKAPPERPPPDLTAGRSGGATVTSAASAFSYVPQDAVVFGLVDPGQVFGVTEWLARAPGLVKAIEELQTGGFDPRKTRLFFFGQRDGAGALSTAVIAEGRLSGVSGARREKVGEVEVHRFDSAGMGVAWPSGLTLVGREPAFSASLLAGSQKEKRLGASATYPLFRDLLERLPAYAGFKLVAIGSPVLSALADRAATLLSTPAAAFLGQAKEAEAVGAAFYTHGSAVRYAVVLRLHDEAAAHKVADVARRALAEGRRPVGDIAHDPVVTLLDSALATMAVRERSAYVFLEGGVPADLLVDLFRR